MESMLPFKYKSKSLEYKKFIDIISSTAINTLYQPIISLSDGSVLGYEALSRGPLNTDMINPELLLKLARKYNKFFELEMKFIMQALQHLNDNKINGKKIFLNISPENLNQISLKNVFTKENLAKYSLNIEEIVLEITERDKILDIENFKEVLKLYGDKKIQFTIDDVGSGYSGLNRMSFINPKYLKLDMYLIRDIDKDITKQAIVKSMYEFSKLSHSNLIAEGIENEAEKTLMKIGVQYGQGYFIQKPKEHIMAIKPEVISIINNINEKRNKKHTYNIMNTSISSITRKECYIDPSTEVSKVDQFFKSNPQLLGTCVVKNGRVEGSITRSSLYSKLGWQYGYSIYSSKPISNIMKTDFLCLDYDTPIDKAIKLAMARNKDALYDHITVLKESEYYGIVTVKDLIEKTIEIEVSNAIHCNPLTGLPGNYMIEQELEKCIKSKQNFCVLYFDLDNFKAYNDVYGFESGDKIIKLLSKSISSNISEENFIGHIGGDDFIAILFSDDYSEVCEKIINDFDSQVLSCYDEKDFKNGYIVSQNRHGIKETFPIVSVSIAVINNKNLNFESIYSLAKESGKIKKKCKMIKGSCYISG